MSYSLHIIRSPIPENDKDAWDHLWSITKKDREERGVGKHRKRLTGAPDFVRFVQSLLEVYPCISTQDDNVDEDTDDYREYIWSDGPLINNAGVDITVLCMTSHHQEAIELMVKTAKELNLVVFDVQSGKIYR